MHLSPLVLATTAVAPALTLAQSYSLQCDQVVLKDNGAAVAERVNLFSEGLAALIETVDSYQGGISGTPDAWKMNMLFGALNEDFLTEAITVTRASEDFTREESAEVAGAFLDLRPRVVEVLDGVLEKKDVFQKGLLGVVGFRERIKGHFKRQRDLVNELGEVVSGKLAPSYADVAPFLRDEFREKYDKAIAAFG